MARNTFTDLFAASLVVVVLGQVLKLAERNRVGPVFAVIGAAFDRLVDPGVPLIDFPPDHPDRIGPVGARVVETEVDRALRRKHAEDAR